MQVIGITGGVGAGKSAILEYLEENYKVKVLVADRIAQMLMDPDTDCYQKLMKFLPVEAYNDDETINRIALADIIFRSEELRHRVNRVVHPAVKEYILGQIEEQRKMGVLDFVVVESALLIEDRYDKICDELWYVYASEEVRRKRLIRARGYSREKIQQIFASQLSDRMYRKNCQVVIDNNGTREETFYQVAQIIKNKGKSGRGKQKLNGDIPLVFGLDIGTRNVVGTVGYKEKENFYVLAQFMREHETRSMLDGQIHDIGRVARTVNAVKAELEEQLDMTLEEVCIAAAGRVLKTVSTSAEYVLPEEAVVTEDDVHALDLLGIEKAQQILNDSNDTNLKFYCVGYSIVKYYLNGDPFSSLVGHKAQAISEDIIVTFLPEDVVEGLYSAVELAGLRVGSLTLEPIAAISVAIPETFRMLNIALVDVGAGTSDISITRDGSIIAYGMIPSAGDEITEMLVQHFLVDFKTAEHIKVSSTTEQEIEYQDIMMLRHTVTAEEVWELIKPLVDKLAEDIASKVKELNGGSTVSATFVVGGGGKAHGFIERLASELELPKERVALRGEEVLQEIYFEQPEIKKDPLLVTPIGICLSYYHQRNNFIFVWVNGERIKLYDNDKLTVLDAALQAGFTNEQLFPGKSREIHFTVNGKRRMAGGEPIEAAAAQINGEICSLNDPVSPNSEIALSIAPAQEEFVCRIEDLEEYDGSLLPLQVNGKSISCPKYVEADGDIVDGQYEIQENDRIKIHGFYTVKQLLVYLGEEREAIRDIRVNGKQADLDTPLYGNFSVEWSRQEPLPFPAGEGQLEEEGAFQEEEAPEEDFSRESHLIAAETFFSEEFEKGESRNFPRGTRDSERKTAQMSAEDQEFQGAWEGSRKPERVASRRSQEEEESEGAWGENHKPERGAFRRSYEETEPEGDWEGSDKPERGASRRSYEETEPEGDWGESDKPERGASRRSYEETEPEGDWEGSDKPEPVASRRSYGEAASEGVWEGSETQEGEISQRSQEEEEPEGAWGGNRKLEKGTAWGSHKGTGPKGAQGGNRKAERRAAQRSYGESRAEGAQGGGHKPVKGAAQRGSGEKKPEEAQEGSKPKETGKGMAGKSTLEVVANGEAITLRGKSSYIFVDVFDAIGFDINAVKGRSVFMRLNGQEPAYTASLHQGDVIEVRWEG